MTSSNIISRVHVVRGVSALALTCASFCGDIAAAQSVPGNPAAPTREEVERQTPARTDAPRARLSVEGDIERAPCALDRPEFRDIRFTPTAAVFEDLRGLSPEDLRPAYEPFLGKEQTLAVVCEIRDRAATILRSAGYIASVEVPQQQIEGGRIRFQVLMAKLVAIRVRGDAGRSERLIASYLEKLTREDVFNREQAERYLLLAGDLPGYSVRLALRSAGQARGEVVGEVTVMHTPFMIDANVQNYGSRDSGRWGGMVRAQAFGLTGVGDRTSVSLFSTADFKEQQTLQLAHDFKVGSEGLGVAGQFTYSWSHPDVGDEDIDVRARTMFATLEANYPFIRTQAATVRGAIGLDVVNQRVKFNDIPLSRDKLRVAFLRVDGEAVSTDYSNPLYTLYEPRWRLASSVELRRGLDILGASDGCGPGFVRCLDPDFTPPTRLEGDATATVLRATAYGEFRPIPRLTFSLGGRAQKASDPLLSFEEFSAGNYTAGRGYDAGTLIGDEGAGLQAEIRVGSMAPRSLTSFALQPFVFVDQAWVRNKDRFAGPLANEELTSVGGGIRAAYGDKFRVDLTFAKPLDRTALAKKPDSRLLLSFSTRLFPWSMQ